MKPRVSENCRWGTEPAVLLRGKRTALTNEDDINSGFGLMEFWLDFRGTRGPQRCTDRGPREGESQIKADKDVKMLVSLVVSFFDILNHFPH